LDYKKLNYSDFKKLITGTDITTTREKFKLDWAKLNIKIVSEIVTKKHRDNSNSKSNSNKNNL